MAALNVRELGDFIRDQRRAAQISLRQLAKQAGVSNPYLSQIERGLRRPSAEILQQIAKALRISAEVLYVQAGILEERQGGEDVMAAILSDESLSERQKQVVLDIYEAFCRENAVATRAGDTAGAPGDTAPPSASPGDGSGAGADSPASATPPRRTPRRTTSPTRDAAKTPRTARSRAADPAGPGGTGTAGARASRSRTATKSTPSAAPGSRGGRRRATPAGSPGTGATETASPTTPDPTGPGTTGPGTTSGGKAAPPAPAPDPATGGPADPSPVGD